MDSTTSTTTTPAARIADTLWLVEEPVRRLASELGQAACNGTLGPRVASQAWSIGDRLSEAMDDLEALVEELEADA